MQLIMLIIATDRYRLIKDWPIWTWSFLNSFPKAFEEKKKRIWAMRCEGGQWALFDKWGNICQTCLQASSSTREGVPLSHVHWRKSLANNSYFSQPNPTQKGIPRIKPAIRTLNTCNSSYINSGVQSKRKLDSFIDLKAKSGHRRRSGTDLTWFKELGESSITGF